MKNRLPTEKSPKSSSSGSNGKAGSPDSSSASELISISSANPFLDVKTSQIDSKDHHNFWIDDLQEELDEKESHIDKLEEKNAKLLLQVQTLNRSLRKAQIENLRQNAGQKI